MVLLRANVSVCSRQVSGRRNSAHTHTLTNTTSSIACETGRKISPGIVRAHAGKPLSSAGNKELKCIRAADAARLRVQESHQHHHHHRLCGNSNRNRVARCVFHRATRVQSRGDPPCAHTSVHETKTHYNTSFATRVHAPTKCHSSVHTHTRAADLPVYTRAKTHQPPPTRPLSHKPTHNNISFRKLHACEHAQIRTPNTHIHTLGYPATICVCVCVCANLIYSRPLHHPNKEKRGPRDAYCVHARCKCEILHDPQKNVAHGRVAAVMLR